MGSEKPFANQRAFGQNLGLNNQKMGSLVSFGAFDKDFLRSF